MECSSSVMSLMFQRNIWCSGDGKNFEKLWKFNIKRMPLEKSVFSREPLHCTAAWMTMYRKSLFRSARTEDQWIYNVIRACWGCFLCYLYILFIQKSKKVIRPLKELMDDLDSFVNFIQDDGVATIISWFSLFRLDIKNCFPWFVLLPHWTAEIADCVRKYVVEISQNLQSLSPY